MTSLRHPYRWLIAAVLLGLAVQPVLLPHPSLVQAVIGGAAAAQGYALAALGGRLARRLPKLPWLQVIPTIRAPGRPMTLALGSAVILVATPIAHVGQLAVASRAGMPGPTLGADVLGVAGAVLVAAVVIGLGSVLRATFRGLTRGMRPTSRRIAALVLAPGLVLTGSSTAAAETAVARPSSISSRIGVEGAAFLRARPNATTIGAVTGRPALTPVRVYIGKDAATSPARRAELAADELERAGGLRRAAILINIPTGSGWVNPAAGTALEYLYGGDIATVVVQYAASPSWLAYLRGGEGVQTSTRALTEAVRSRLDRLSTRQRPRLLIYGESLGAWGGLRAYDGALGAGMAGRTDGALWAGVPGPLPARPPSGTRTVVHADDPVPAWSLPLLLHACAAWPGRWLPVASFWQATGETIVATGAPPGHGHRYGAELVDAWRPLISTAGLPGAAPPDRIDAVHRAIG